MAFGDEIIILRKKNTHTKQRYVIYHEIDEGLLDKLRIRCHSEPRTVFCSKKGLTESPQIRMYIRRKPPSCGQGYMPSVLRPRHSSKKQARTHVQWAKCRALKKNKSPRKTGKNSPSYSTCVCIVFVCVRIIFFNSYTFNPFVHLLLCIHPPSPHWQVKIFSKSF